jgi:hypothetical protein
MIYTPANTKCFTNAYNTNVRIKPEMIVPKTESSGFFILLLLSFENCFTSKVSRLSQNRLLGKNWRLFEADYCAFKLLKLILNSADLNQGEGKSLGKNLKKNGVRAKSQPSE